MRSRKRKLLKVDELLLPESKIKPVGSKKRKVKEKDREDENPSDLSDSDVEKDKNRHAAFETNNNKHQTVAMFDLWKTQGTCTCLLNTINDLINTHSQTNASYVPVINPPLEVTSLY